MSMRDWNCRNCGAWGRVFAEGANHARLRGHWVEFAKPAPSPFAHLTNEEFLALPIAEVVKYENGE